MDTQENPQVYDVVVVGGGAAGLNAALVLARARRRVAVVDAGAPRNAPATHMHGFLSRDGMAPAQLLATGRTEVAGYGGELITGRVEAIEHGFFVRLAEGRVLRARRVLVATGCRDDLPEEIAGVRERWGKDLLNCPYCHGYEVRDQPIGVLGAGPGAVEHALLVQQWSSDVIMFSHTLTLTVEDRERLTARKIQIVEGQVTRLVAASDGDRLRGVELADGQVVPRAAVFLRPHNVPHDDLLIALGCQKDSNGWVDTDASGGTSVFGVWAAGNVINPRAQVITAAGQGSVAAIAINHDLIDEDVERAIEASRTLATVGRNTVRSEFSAELEAQVTQVVLGDRRHGL